MQTQFDVEAFLAGKGIPFESLSFEMERDANALMINRGDIDPHTVYKTIALTGNVTGPLIAVVPLDSRISYKKLAQVTGNKKIGLIPQDDLIKTTGYQHGTNNPVGIWATKQYPIFIDQQSIEPHQIFVSNGQLGQAIKIDIISLTELVDAKLYDLVEQ